MKYIKKVILENFQSHKHTELEFDSKLNVIVGPSDSGKTAILRGIRWVLYNEPSGDYFIREGENYCSVTIEFNDGTKIKRYRSRSKNAYYLYDSQNNEKTFEGFGTSVPEEIINATGIKKVLLDSELSKSINLSDQLEGAFLLSEKASTRASSIGRLVGVNIIDDTVRDTLKDIRNLTLKKRNIEERILNLEDELSKYEYLKELQDRINKLSIIRDEISSKESKLNFYNDVNEKIKLLYKEKEEVQNILFKLNNIEALNNLQNNISSLINRYNYLATKKEQLERISIDKQYNLNVINSLKDISKVEIITNNIAKLHDLNNQLIKYKATLSKINDEANKCTLLKEKLNGTVYLEKNLDKMFKIIEKLKILCAVKEKVDNIKKSLAIGEKYIQKFENLDKINNIKEDLEQKIIKLNKLKTLYSNLTSINNEIKNVQLSIKQYNETIENRISEYKDLLLKLEVCPLCFSSIDEKKIEHVIRHYIQEV